jgi:3,4-dihydroxy 2-butanone 4-phosphate synthase/GTP cyclohydrolase II
VIVVDDEDRENEGDLVMAAEHVTQQAEIADRLRLQQMVQSNQDPAETAYTVSVDAAAGIESGISAADRAHSLRVLADPAATPGMLRRPGHVLPLRARAGGHTEAAVALTRLCDLTPVAAFTPQATTVAR